MKRRSFLQVPAAAAALPFMVPDPAALVPAINGMGKRPGKGVLVRAGEDRSNQPFDFLDASFRVMVSGKDNDGRCVIFDTIRREKVGPTLHKHTDCDEWFFVLDGEFKFQVGDEVFRLKPGDSLYGPMNVPHAFVKTSEGPARLVVMHFPAVTMEECLRAMSRLPDQSVESRRTLMEQHGIVYVGPPLKPD